MIAKFIRVADQSAKLGNFFSVFSILGALCFPEVTKLRGAWDRVPEKVKRLQSHLENLMNPSRNMKVYRDQLKSLNDKSCVPCLPLHLKDLVFANEAGSIQKNGVINYEKLALVAKCIARLTALPPYASLKPDAALQA